MTIDEARELLGKEGEWLSDEEIQRDIEVAKLFKDSFFELAIRK